MSCTSTLRSYSSTSPKFQDITSNSLLVQPNLELVIRILSPTCRASAFKLKLVLIANCCLLRSNAILANLLAPTELSVNPKSTSATDT